jgi:hypothetical protein
MKPRPNRRVVPKATLGEILFERTNNFLNLIFKYFIPFSIGVFTGYLWAFKHFAV